MYNWALGTWKKWVAEKESGLRTDSPNWIKLYRVWVNERPEWARKIPGPVLTYELRDVNTAFTNHFKFGKGWPKFKKRGRSRDSFRETSQKCSIREDGLHIHIGWVKKDIRMAEKLRISGKIVSYCVSYTAGRWYVSVQVDTSDTRTAPDSICGVDVGMKIPAVCSDGTILALPTQKLCLLERRRRKAERLFCKRMKDSRRRAKALLRKQRIQEKINNIRRDSIHKFTSTVCKNHATVVVESLNVAGMHHGPRNVRKGMKRSCMSETLRQLRYKAIRLVEADRWYPSSQLCSKCGNKQKLTLKQRTYRCPVCGLAIDRDLNAAINLSKYPGSQG